MLQRTSRSIGPFLAGLLLLTACGSDDGTDDAGGMGLSNFSVDGDFGKEPEVEWNGPVEVAETESDTPIEGSGDEVTAKTSMLAQVWVGNGTTKEKTFFQKGATQPLKLDELPKPVGDSLEGAKVGSRTLIAATADDSFGEQGNPEIGIGNKDTVVFIIDVIDVLPDGPEGKEVEPAAWAPAVVESDGKPTSLNFTGKAKPTGGLLKTVLIEGAGKPVAKGQTIYVNYLGQVFGDKKPFDESYSKGTPFSFPVGQEPPQVLVGWDTGLRGVKVGSRVILQVPPDKGYGEKGKPPSIKGTDTMYFVVDVLYAAATPEPPEPSPTPSPSGGASPSDSPNSGAPNSSSPSNDSTEE
jgi:peptidylprolyl isomerase